MNKSLRSLFGWQLLILVIFSACSTISRLPEGAVLYTGVEGISEQESLASEDEIGGSRLPADVRDAVHQTLEVAPSDAFLGSAYRMSPIPFGLWIYNGLYTERSSGFRHWLWKRFKTDPILLDDVNPELRCRVAESTLKDHGYFDALVTYEVSYRDSDQRKAKVRYAIDSHSPKYLTEISFFAKASPRIDSIICHTLSQSLLHVGDRFSSAAMEAERDRIVRTVRDSGYYYYSQEQIKFLADTLDHQGVRLRVYCCANASDNPRGLLPCTFDSVTVNLDWGAELPKSNHDTLGFFRQNYNGPRAILPLTVRNCFPMRYHSLYRSDRPTRAQANLARLNTFKYVRLSLDCLTTDSAADSLSLCVRADATYAEPWQGKLGASLIYKDNDQFGPSLSFTTIRRNLFHGGETFSATVNAGYEWSLGESRIKNKGKVDNSYEFGILLNLTAPRLYLPARLQRNDRRFPVTTRIGLSLMTQARAGFFSLVKSSAEISYNYYTSPVSNHTFTPIRLSHSRMLQTTEAFSLITASNKALKQSFDDCLIPQMQYIYTYDDSRSNASRAQQHYLQLTLSEAGALTDGLTALFSQKEQGQRTVMGQSFSQFLRASADFRYFLTLAQDVRLATRLTGGLAYAYGNSSSIPYTETFYVGGPNSLRGFGIRSVGPGSNSLYRCDAYGYLLQVGDVKFEANAELRFRLLGDIHGAFFADAGNVWRLRGRSLYDSADFFHGLGDLATDIGFGIRYDLGMLVARFDIGLPLHDPGREGASYFNCRHALLRQFEYNLAIGYPF